MVTAAPAGGGGANFERSCRLRDMETDHPALLRCNARPIRLAAVAAVLCRHRAG